MHTPAEILKNIFDRLNNGLMDDVQPISEGVNKQSELEGRVTMTAVLKSVQIQSASRGNFNLARIALTLNLHSRRHPEFLKNETI